MRAIFRDSVKAPAVRGATPPRARESFALSLAPVEGLAALLTALRCPLTGALRPFARAEAARRLAPYVARLPGASGPFQSRPIQPVQRSERVGLKGASRARRLRRRGMRRSATPTSLSTTAGDASTAGRRPRSVVRKSVARSSSRKSPIFGDSEPPESNGSGLSRCLEISLSFWRLL